MTAITGFWSLDGRRTAEPCAKILAGVSAYGSNPRQTAAGPIHIGRALHSTVPEDAYDRGPLNEGPLWLVADTRLDNRSELARATGIDEASLRILSDSALLFKCLLRFGDAAVDMFVGEFAFALWNQDKAELLLARDILGTRPLYFHRARGFAAFASMPSGLHALPDVPYDFDPDFMRESLALLPWAGRRTWFRDIERVPPAHFVRMTATATTSIRYWNPRTQAIRRTPAEHEEGLRAAFDTAVRAQLRGAGDTVATHLSSGLDSPAVTATAAMAFAPHRVVAFTAVPRKGFDGPVPKGTFASEAPLAALTARRYANIEHVLVDTSGDALFDPLDREHFYQQQPISNICNATWSRAINGLAQRRGIKVLLTGSAGNLTMSYGGLEHLSQLLARGRVIEAARQARALAAGGTAWGTIGWQLLAPLLPLDAWKLVLKANGRASSTRDFTSVRRDRYPSLETEAKARRMDFAFRPSMNGSKRALWALAREDGGNYYKGVLAQFGLSVRDPTADKRVVEYALTVPAEEWVRGGVRRSLARRVFRDRLPVEVIAERLRGYQSADWFEKLDRERPALAREIEAIERCEDINAAMEPGWMRRALSDWPAEGWAQPDTSMTYRWSLLRAVSAGRFMRKVRGSN